MALIKREPVTDVAESVHALYRDRHGDWQRNHLGASIIGNQCDRFLWLSFRWAAKPKHDGRMLRLFERGHREEAWLIDDLRQAGFTVTGEQLRVKEGHIGGSLDGIISGLVEDPEEEHVLELKTSNVKQWGRLRERGVRSVKPIHYVQMQIYMHKLGLKHALYVSVCKDNDEIYTERVAYSKRTAEKHLERARAVIAAEAPPKKLDASLAPCVLVSRDGTRWPCQFYENCHGTKMPERNCRTCVSSRSDNERESGEKVWTCHVGDMVRILSPEEQREGCHSQISIPDIVNGKVAYASAEKRKVRYQFPDGTQSEEC